MPGLRPVTQGGITVWAEPRPTDCPARHRLVAGRILVGWRTCGRHAPARGHRTWTCLHRVDREECGLVIYIPSHWDGA